jgi:hypothetical protein
MTPDIPDYRNLFDLAGRVALVAGGGSGIAASARPSRSSERPAMRRAVQAAG